MCVLLLVAYLLVVKVPRLADPVFAVNTAAKSLEPVGNPVNIVVAKVMGNYAHPTVSNAGAQLTVFKEHVMEMEVSDNAPTQKDREVHRYAYPKNVNVLMETSP